MAKKIGQDSEAFFMHTKRPDFGMHKPRLKPTPGLSYMIGPIGADHYLNIKEGRDAI
jgi:aldehyde:ferredoxin oxidoreductase